MVGKQVLDGTGTGHIPTSGFLISAPQLLTQEQLTDL